jgi:glycosyltransferase involved in cell wall biosynthesis
LRLAVVSPFVDRRHGTERALAELLERLARDYQCEIHLYAQRVADLAVTPSSRSFPEKRSGIFWHKVPTVPGPQLVQFLSWFYLNRLWRCMDRFLRHASFDLVLSPGINCADADVLFVHVLFHRLRELLREDGGKPAVDPGFLRRLHRRAYYKLLVRFEKRIYSNHRVTLTAVSLRTAELLAKHFGRRDVPVIPNGVDALQFFPAARLGRREAARAWRGFQAGELILLLVGNDWMNKGLLTVLDALSALADVPARLLIVGDDAPAPFREKARRLGVEDRCTWEPAAADILDAYAPADIYVSPSREDSFGMPVAEAMACGLPVITSIFAGVSSLLHDRVDSFILRDPRDAKKLAELIGALYKQEDLRTRLGEAAAKASAEWTWDRNGAAAWELLKRVSAKKLG